MFELQKTDLKSKREYEEEVKLQEQAMGISIQSLGAELAMEKIKSMAKDTAIQTLGGEIANLKLEIMRMKGGIE